MQQKRYLDDLVTPSKNGAQKFSSRRGLDVASWMLLGPDFRREDELFHNSTQRHPVEKRGPEVECEA